MRAMDEHASAAVAGSGVAGDLSVREIVVELAKREHCSDRAVMSCSRQASFPAFVKEFVALGGLGKLLDALQVLNQPRAVKANVRASASGLFVCVFRFPRPLTGRSCCVR